MSLIKAAKAITEYYFTTRGVGHTNALKNGFNNTPDALFMSVVHRQNEYFKIPKDQAVTLHTAESGKLKGYNKPLIMDHHVSVLIINDLLHEIEHRDDEIKRLTNDHLS